MVLIFIMELLKGLLFYCKDIKMQSEKIISIKHIGIQKTLDLEVKSDSHIFYANNIATSNSHSFSYGLIAEYTAFVKSHFPLHFYTAFLQHAEDKLDKKQEVKELIEDMNNFNIKISPPKVTNSIIDNYGRFCINNKNVDFGLASIKSLGKSHIQKLYTAIKLKIDKLQKAIEKFSWLEFLCEITPLTGATVVENLILTGATPDFSLSRKRKALEYKMYSMLTDRELQWINNNYKDSLLETLNRYSVIERKDGGPSNDKRRIVVNNIIETLTNPAYNLTDSPEWIVNNERELLGISLSYNAIEAKKISTGYTCRDFLNNKKGKIEIICEISTVKETIIKNGKSAGQKMAFITIKDQTAKIEAVCFSEVFSESSSILFEGNVILCSGLRSNKSDSGLIITNVKQI